MPEFSKLQINSIDYDVKDTTARSGVASNAANISANASNIATQAARIDQFTHLPNGSTSGDAELMDIRVGADGFTYDSAGAAVRANDSLLKSHLDAVSEGIVGGAETAVNTITGTQVYYNTQYGLLGFRTRTDVNVNVYAVEARKTYYVTGYGKSGENDPAAVLALANVSSGTTAYFAVVDGAGSSYAYINQAAITPAQNGYIYVNINASDIKVGLKKQKTINNLLPDVTYLKQQTLDYMLQSYTIKNGYYIQNSASYTANASYFSVYESCTPGEKFKISSKIKDAVVPYVQFYNSSNAVLSWIPNGGTLPETVSDYEFTVPSEAAYFSVTSYQTRPVVYKYTLAVDQAEHFPLYLHRRNALAEVMFKYAAEKDAVVVFNKVGPNNILQIAGFATVANDTNYCSGNFDAARTTLRNAGSDWMSPYKVIAVNNADGDGSGQGVNGYYTGGFHGYNGNQTGAATGATTAFQFFVDGKEITETTDAIYRAEKEVVILVTNAIQGNNTTKSNGTGRAILQEQIKYTITQNRIDIVNTITALEDIVVSQYYGLQLYAFSNMTGFEYFGDTHEIHDFSAATTYTDEIDYLVGGVAADPDRLVCQLDRKGIGRHQYIKSGGIMARSIAGGKAYNNLIDNSPTYLPLSTGDSVFISGHYAFAEGCVPN